MKTSINKPFEYEAYYQKLGNDKEVGRFDNMKDILVLTSILGFIREDRKPFNKPGGDAIKEHIFQEDMNIFDMIAVLATDDIKILLNERRDEKYKLIEEYAHGGIQYLVENIYNGPITTVNDLINFVLSFDERYERKHADLSDLISEVVNELEE